MKVKWPGWVRYRIKYYFDLFTGERVRTNLLQAMPLWMASLLTGMVAVGYTKLFGWSEDLLQYILQGRNWMIFIFAPLCFFFAWFIVQKLAPNARGSGIPQMMAAIELAKPKTDSLIDRLLSLKIAAVKIVSSLLMVLGGGAIGREGPTIQIAGSIFRAVNKWIPATWPKLSNQSFILTGGAAGLAAAFNTPLGGIVFAMEELSKIHLRFFRTALFTAVIIAGLTAQALLGPYLYLGYPDVKHLQFTIFFAVAATAVMAGFLGSIMGKWTLAFMKWKRRQTPLKGILFPIAAGLIIALIAYFISSDILGSGKNIMNKVLFTANKETSWYTILLRMTGTMLCFNTGAAGGVFAPSLAAGASVGAYIAHVFDVADANANILILSGMVGFLTGITRTPFTSAILVLEMTDRHSVIFHLMLAAIISNIAALLVEKRSFYEQLKENFVEQSLENHREQNH